VPLGIAVAGANRNDHLLVEETLNGSPRTGPVPPAGLALGLWLDKGYAYAAVAEEVRGRGYVPHVVPRDAERQLRERIPGYRARRWPVERTHSWMNRFRRILVRWEKKRDNYVGFVHLVCAFIAFKQAHLLG
jgi:putative transposase